MKYTSIFMLLILCFSCQKPPVEHTEECNWTPEQPHPKATLFQAVLDKYTAKGLPGISALVRDSNGLWIGSSGKADISNDVDMAPCTISKAASTTKTFVAALALKLVEEGNFNLDDMLTKWLSDEVLDNVKNARQCSVRQLMNHTTGIADVIKDNAFYLSVLNNPTRKWEEADLIKFVYGDEPVFAPGAGVAYSNTNFLLLAMVIEAASGRQHGELLREKIIQPLGLTNTFYYWHDPVPNTTAQGYFDLYNNGTILNVTNYNTGSGNGYGGVYSDIFDLQHFIEALVRNRTVLSENLLNEMLTFTPPEADANRANGLGIFHDFLERPAGQQAYGHRGRDLGYTADMYWFPEQDYTMTYLINYGTDAKSDLKEVFMDFRTEFTDAVMQP